jgi:hypothetical protein
VSQREEFIAHALRVAAASSSQAARVSAAAALGQRGSRLGQRCRSILDSGLGKPRAAGCFESTPEVGRRLPAGRTDSQGPCGFLRSSQRVHRAPLLRPVPTVNASLADSGAGVESHHHSHLQRHRRRASAPPRQLHRSEERAEIVARANRSPPCGLPLPLTPQPSPSLPAVLDDAARRAAPSAARASASPSRTHAAHRRNRGV